MQRGGTFKTIASTELLATLYATVLLVPGATEEETAMGVVAFSAGTDNKGSSGLIKKWLTTKLPLALVAMELAAQLSLPESRS